MLLISGSSIGALVNPLRGGICILSLLNFAADLVAALGEVTGYYACRAMRERMLGSDTGRRILKSRTRISSKLLDMERLKGYPEKSFGRQHYLFFDSHGISPDTRSKVQYIEDEELAFVMSRYRDNHDFLHTLSGLPISVVSELGLKWFEFKQTGLPMAFLGSVFGPLALPPSDFGDFYRIYKPWAEFAAHRCAFFMNFEFESLLEHDIDDVRRMMNFAPYKCGLWSDPSGME
jgi:ubiquinone biosynthesis protein COQ4